MSVPMITRPKLGVDAKGFHSSRLLCESTLAMLVHTPTLVVCVSIKKMGSDALNMPAAVDISESIVA